MEFFIQNITDVSSVEKIDFLARVWQPDTQVHRCRGSQGRRPGDQLIWSHVVGVNPRDKETL